MTCARWASIDVGTNSVLLTIVEPRADGDLTPRLEVAEITRIGEGLAAHGCFQPAAMERTATVLERYAALCREHQVTRIIAVGTAAFRRATNADQFIAAVRQRCGITLEVISGAREAALSYGAATRDFGSDALVLDIGGGSTEFIWQADSRLHAHSLSLGSVTLQEQLVHSDPISDADYAAVLQAIVTQMDTLPVIAASTGPTPRPLIALAGSATTLAAMHLQLAQYSHDQVHGTVLTGEDIAALLARLRAASLAERRQMRGLEAARADVILSGTMILQETLRRYGMKRATISDRGVRWGLLYELAGEEMQNAK
ncbi:MAG: Ppx/GppA family phosphatase [Deltaproteobacteria bacterium]|nr:Ppx/GppA family phosphatase [Deltaproteobacteria bacterium]